MFHLGYKRLRGLYRYNKAMTAVGIVRTDLVPRGDKR